MTRTDARSGPSLRVGLCGRTGGYFRAMSNITLIIVIVVAVAIIVALVVAGYQMARRKRTERLRQQYGPEYDRAIEKADSQRAAESELRERAKRHDELELRSLDSSERADFERRWTDVQAQFVDDPSTAVRNADRFVVEVMAARGYPVEEDFDQRADDLSVRHAEVTQRYREARRIAQANEDGGVDTEDLRQAVTSYRALVQALLAGDGDATGADATRGPRRHQIQAGYVRTRAGQRPDDGTGDQGMSTDATTTDGRTTDTPQTEEAAGSAAERLGGPSEREQRLERASEEETGARRQADTAEAPTDDARSETASDTTSESSADTASDTGAEERATLIPPDRAESYNSRWTQLKSDFVDEPSRAVRGANELVGEVLDELEELFRSQRAELEQGLDSEQTTTEDLRQALGRYRSFFDRLLSF